MASPMPVTHLPDPVPPVPKLYRPHTSPRPPIAALNNTDLSISELQHQEHVESGSQTPKQIAEQTLAPKGSHGRNNSHSIGQTASPLQSGARRRLKPKKSLPDLRLSHEDILTERRSEARPNDIPGESSRRREAPEPAAHDSDPQTSSPALPMRRPSSAPRRPPLPQSASNPLNYPYKNNTSWGGGVASSPGQMASGSNISASGPGSGGLRKLSLPTVGATQAAAEAAAAAMAARSTYSNTPTRMDGHGRMPSDKLDGGSSRSNSPTVVRNPADLERNSYFRRLSTLPPSTISKTVPLPVLKFIDGTRGALFALSQIHTALKQYILFATDERISSQFNRVLDIASGSMTNFINSLDRFDSLSRRGTPEPSVIRGVLLTCKESVLTFRKVVSVLQLQLRALQSSADVRFTRTLLLMLYGSMAEVSNSWASMAPQVDAVLPYLTQETAAPTATGGLTRSNGSVSLKASLGSSTTPTLPSIAERSTPVRSSTRGYVPNRPSKRRHAGSFSAHDVAHGATMPPSNTPMQSFNLEELQAASAYNTPARPTRSKSNASNGVAPNPEYFAYPASNQTPGAQPSTPGGASFARTTAPSSVTASPSRQHCSTSNASLTGESIGLANGLTSMTPFTSAVSSASHKKHPSNATAAVISDKMAVDDHLLMLIDQITALSAEVWATLLSHLTKVGVKSEPVTPTGAQTRNRSTSIGEGSVTHKKLRDLRELAHNTGKLTSKLRKTFLRAKEEEQEGDEQDLADKIGAETVSKLFEEAHHFVRAIVNISTLIKAISEKHSFPRELRRSLGEVTHGCSALTVHLLWLSPTSIS